MTLFLISLGVISLIMLDVFVRCRRIKSDFSSRIQQMIMIGIFITLLVVGMTLCSSEKVSLILFAVYFCTTDWLMFVIAKFSLVYTNNEKYERIINFLFPVLIFDIFYLAMNVEKNYAFSVRLINTGLGEIYKFEPTPLFGVHMAIVYFLIVFSLLTFLVKAIKAPRLYKKKYYILFGIVMAIVVWNAVLMFTGDTLDFSVYGYGLGAILFYYFTLVYIPNELMDRAITVVSEDAQEGIIIFDEVNCIYANPAARRFLRVDGSDGIERLVGMGRIDLLKRYFDENFEDTGEEQEFELKGTRDSQRYVYNAKYKKIEDQKNKDMIGTSLVIYDKTEDQNRLDREKYAARHDSLTELYNKEYFLQTVSECLQEDKENKYILACSDITKFKLINDLFGERIADGMLVKEANEIKERFGNGCKYGRLAADRFAVLMPRQMYDEKVLTEIATSINYVDRDYAYTVKMCWGVYEVTDIETPVSTMCDRALGAMLPIKDDYRIFVAYYNEDTIESVKREQELIAELDDAIDRRDITIFLQPIVKPDGTVIGAEALARWIHPKKGMISPGEFIPVFEKNNLIVKLDLHIWEIACQRLRIWMDEGKDWFISVNISIKDLYFLDIFDVFTKLVSRYKIPAEKIRLEITESAVVKDINTVTSLINRLQRFGFIVEIDDFGSGYSSLNMLKDLTVDVLKIDMKFLSRADENPRSKEILRSVIELAKNLKMEVITEGVETQTQVEFLKEANCDLLQGFYFSKPVPEGDFIQTVGEIKSKVC